jgi:hypothetical protein
METQFTWKTKLFSRRFEIYQYTKQIGELKKEGMSRTTTGEINGKRFNFKTKGFFKHETEITDPDSNIVLATIRFKSFKIKATIIYNEKEYPWQFDNFFRTKWSIGSVNGPLIKYHSKNLQGTIDSYTDDELLVLAGFFIRNYEKQKSAEAAAAS